MGLNFRKSIKIGAGIRLNISKKGIGASVGVKGARVGIGPNGKRASASIPGTGISYQKTLGKNKSHIGQVESNIDYAKRRKINKVLYIILFFIIIFFALIIILANLPL